WAREAPSSGGAAERHLASGLAEQTRIRGGVRLRRNAEHGVLAGGGDGRGGSAEEGMRVVARGYRADAVANDLAEHDHAAIRRGEVLQGVHGDVALARLRVVVGGVALPLRVRPVVGLAEAGAADLLRGESPRRIPLRQL